MLMGQAEALRPSSQSELEKQLDRSGQELLRGPRAHGYATDLWTCPRVGAVIRRLFGIEYSDCHVWKLLRKMGWTRQRPARRAKERDEERIANWVREDWPRLKRGL
jgi:transposase